jgi:hypothetical protein
MTIKKFQMTLVITLILIITSLLMPNQPKAQTACSPSEVQLIIDGFQQIFLAAAIGDMNRILQLNQILEDNISMPCKNAVTAAQLQQQQQAPYSPYSGGNQGGYVPKVYDHGGGTYSVPGVGACGPSGCMPF